MSLKINTLLTFLLLGTQPGMAQQQAKAETGFTAIFNGKNLTGWVGDTAYWRVENGTIVGEIRPDKPLKTNSFLIWQGGEPADFELKGEFVITEAGNSGVNYRSDRVPDLPYALRGYQADIDGRRMWTGQNYEERKRTTLAYRGEKATINPFTGEATAAADRPEAIRAKVNRNAWTNRTVTGSLGTSDSLKTLVRTEGWNSFRLVVKGNKMQHYVNDVLMSEVIDEDTVNGRSKGLLGVQVHVGPPMKVQYRNLMLKSL